MTVQVICTINIPADKPDCFRAQNLKLLQNFRVWFFFHSNLKNFLISSENSYNDIIYVDRFMGKVSPKYIVLSLHIIYQIFSKVFENYKYCGD